MRASRSTTTAKRRRSEKEEASSGDEQETELLPPPRKRQKTQATENDTTYNFARDEVSSASSEVVEDEVLITSEDEDILEEQYYNYQHNDDYNGHEGYNCKQFLSETIDTNYTDSDYNPEYDIDNTESTDDECKIQNITTTKKKTTRKRGQKKKRGRKRIFHDERKKNRKNFNNRSKKQIYIRKKWSLKIWQDKLFKNVKENVKYSFRIKNFENFDENKVEYRPNIVDKMNNECPFCSALLFKFETKCHHKKWTFCCNNGEITLPEFEKPPKRLHDLLTQTSNIAKFFQKNIFIINSALRLCSSKLSQKRYGNKGLPKFILSGKVVHCTPNFNKENNEYNEYQLYTLDPEQQINNRLNLPFLQRIRQDPRTRDLIKGIQELLAKHNWLIKAYQNIYTEYIKNQKTIPELNFKIQSNINPGKEKGHYKQYSEPVSNNKIATIVRIPDDYNNKPQHEEIIITNNKNINRVINETHPLSDALAFPIFHPYGETTYSKILNITMRQYYRYRLFERKNSWNPFIHGKRLFEAYITNQWGKIEQNQMNQIKNLQKVKKKYKF